MRRLLTLMLIIPLVLSCTLDVTTPIEAPPEAWDPALNTHPDESRFQSLLNAYVREGLPGVVLFVRTPEGLFNGAAGYAKIETAVPMTPTHRHYAASVTKMYTATAIMLLAQDGLIELDVPFSRYLSNSICDDIPNASTATVRQLLNHRSGIPDFSGQLAYELDTLNDPLGAYPPERLLSYVKGKSAMPTTAGIPSARATIAAWESAEPSADTRPTRLPPRARPMSRTLRQLPTSIVGSSPLAIPSAFSNR